MRRMAIVAHYDARGRLGAYVDHFVGALREHVEHIVLVVNGELVADDLERARSIFDDVMLRDNSGFDVYGYRDGYEANASLAAEMDELLLVNTTFYGPVHDLGPIFERMDAQELDFWGMTDHPETRPNPITGDPVMHGHLQSYWLAIRRSVYTSAHWESYWSSMPAIVTYLDAVQHNEVRFTHYFGSRGFRWASAFPSDDIPVANATMEAPELLLDAGYPFVKRRLFFHDPLHFEEHALIGRDVRMRLEASGYPMELVWEDANHKAQPRFLQANMSMLEVLPDVDEGGADPSGLRIGVLAHIFYEDMADEMLDLCDHLPGGYTLIATTPTEEKRAAIEATLERRGRHGDEVRVVASNRGRDISAFLIGCRDVLESDRFDVVLKIHSKKSLQAQHNQGRLFKRHLFENLLHSDGYVTNLLRLFEEHPTVGMVFPPMVHIGYPTLGRAWFTNEQRARTVARELGIDVEFDGVSPVAPFGSMFFARPKALAKLVDGGFDWSDFPEEGGYFDGSLPHVLERLFGYATLDAGYEVRTAMTTEQAAASYTSLEFKLQEMMQHVPGEPKEQVLFARGLGGGKVNDSVMLGLRIAGRSFAKRNKVTAKATFEAIQLARRVRSRLGRR